MKLEIESEILNVFSEISEIDPIVLLNDLYSYVINNKSESENSDELVIEIINKTIKEYKLESKPIKT